ncbi:MAG: hypothetical protein DRP15_03140 [Candidatus Aenigmatarchaeota archaeon]|nr:MAG: hypothetical protein DRP15_03140 [Candidatus Aenigmarchaeota archaeon]
MELDVDFLVPAALENQITEKNVDSIRAKYILELANGPVTTKADEKLFKEGVTIIPDVLANAGGVAASYLEWMQNKAGTKCIYERKDMTEKLVKIMVTAFDRVYGFSQKENISMRTASYVIGIKRILEAERLRGRI